LQEHLHRLVRQPVTIITARDITADIMGKVMNINTTMRAGTVDTIMKADIAAITIIMRNDYEVQSR
jgi:hypothetical protein